LLGIGLLLARRLFRKGAA